MLHPEQNMFLFGNSRQHGTDFVPEPQPHCHQPVVGSLAAVRITSSVKEKAMKDFYQLAENIVQEVLLEELNSAPCPAMPKVANLVRQANRRRQKSRPVEPKDLEFELNPEHIPAIAHAIAELTWWSLNILDAYKPTFPQGGFHRSHSRCI